MKRLVTILIILISAISSCLAQDSEMKRIKVILKGYVILDTLVNSKEEITILDLSASQITDNVSSPKTTTKDTQISRFSSTPQTQSSTNPNSTYKASSTTSTKRCAATTKKGKRCSRNAEPGSNYCWQHK